MKKSWKQWMAITCALAMIVSLLPVTILAEEGVATPTDLAPVAEIAQETESVEELVENTAEESVEEPAAEPEGEKVTYTARIAAAKRDGKIFLTAFVEPELVGKVTWEMKRPGQADEKWIRIENDSPTLVIVPGSELIGKEIRFRLEDGTISNPSYIVPELEPEEAPEAGTEEPDVEIIQEEPDTDKEIAPAEEQPTEESTDETTEEPETEVELTIDEAPAEELAEEEQEIEDYETPLGLNDIAETDPEVQEESNEEPAGDEPVEELTEEEPAVEETEKDQDAPEEVIVKEEPASQAVCNDVSAKKDASENQEDEEILDGMDIREEADGMSVIINTIPKDAEIDVLGVEGDWVLVDAEGEQGYIYVDDVESRTETEEQEEETEEELEGIEEETEGAEEETEQPEEPEEADEEAETEEVIDTSNMKVTIFTSRRRVMRNGAPITLTSKLEGFDGIEEIKYQWYCDKGNGYEPVDGANSDSYTYTANPETLSWGWQLEVSF